MINYFIKLSPNVLLFLAIFARASESKAVSSSTIANHFSGSKLENDNFELNQSEDPFKGSFAYSSLSESTEIYFNFKDDFQHLGHLCFWFYFKKDYIPSNDFTIKHQPIKIELPGFANFVNEARKNDFQFTSICYSKDKKDKIRKLQQVPRLSKGWHHCT